MGSIIGQKIDYNGVGALSTPPGLFLDNPNYRIIRRDRSRNGEGIMAYVKFFT